MNTVTITMAFLMGLTGSLHCAGMCGPIMMIMPFGSLSGFRKWVSVGAYHLGRISVYASMGAILYSFKTLFRPEWQQYISIALGSLLLVTGLLTFFSGKQVNLPWAGFVKKHLGTFISNPGVFQLFVAGMLNGLLPCGLVYMALSVAVTASSPLLSSVFMYAFGLGTVPMLVGLVILKNKTFLHRWGHTRRLVPVVMFVFGTLFIVRGMNLGIPYLSPKVVVEHNEVKASCCHK